VIIEWLRFQVPEDWHDRFCLADAAVWTAFLQTCPGYLGKQVWRSPDQPDALVLVIRWVTRAQWKGIDPEVLAQVDRRFVAAVGRSFELVEVQEYEEVGDAEVL
jgi:uncharacterized protein (TIGR03792 family)